MVAIVLFWIGLILSVVVGVTSFTLKTGDAKKGVIALPFAILLAAAVARYIGL